MRLFDSGKYPEIKHFGPEEFQNAPILHSLPNSLTIRRLKTAEEQPVDQFIRSVDVVPAIRSRIVPRPFWRAVRKVLSNTDRELKICAEACEAEVVPHTWGTFADDHGFLRIAARVDRILPFCDGGPKHPGAGNMDLPPEIEDKLYDGLEKYNAAPHRFTGVRLYDLKSTRQFMYGFNARDNEQREPKLFLVDIEPVFRQKPAIGF